ncbi:MAG: C4-dicarboxylate ABC transporter [Alphaproteobacteria bacterium]|nr:C4-dicarboxylate ABC transporter [Alphaproteobacteria bacterium]
MKRRQFLTTAAAVGTFLAAPAIVRPASAQAVTLRLHHFLPPQSNGHAKMLAPWADIVAKASNNAIKIEIYPSMQLGGTPPQLYNQARDGVVDIVWTLPGYTPGRFPITETIEVPFIANTRGIVNALACEEFGRANLGEETKEVKLLCFWAHDAGLIHSTKQVKTMEDLRGMKLRNPARLTGEALKALGATSVGMPVPQIAESLAQKVIDGAVVPWEVVPAVRIQELCKYHTAIPGSPTLYTAGFFLAMNLQKYAGLPGELKKVIDDTSGPAFAKLAGNMWDTEAKTVSTMVKERGNVITTITEEEKARWVKATAHVTTDWVEQMKGRNIDGAKLIASMKSLLAKHANA